MRYKTLYKNLHSFTPKFVGEKTQGQIMYWVRKMMSTHNVQVNKIIDKTNTCFSALTVGGFYDPSLDFGEKDIEIYLMFQEQHEKIVLCESIIKIMINELFKTLTHEKRHRYQFKKRGLAYGPVYKVKNKFIEEDILNDLKYYGDPDEIDAYALESAIEKRLHGTSETMAKYKELFDKYDKKVYNKFLKKYYRYDNKITL